MADIQFNNVNKIFEDGTHAVRDLSLVVSEGELLVIVGPSGCGKSTVLRMVAGLEDITGGTIVIGGKTVNNLQPQQRNVAMVFQNYALYPHMTVRKNIAFPLKMMRLSKKEQNLRVEETADLLGLTSLLSRMPKSLSGGQKQRVAMGRALVRDPKVLLLDEPLSNLDAKLRLQIRNEIAALQRRLGRTTLYVTHDQVEAMTLGDRVVVLADGFLQQVDPPKELYESPANIFVAGFIGNPGMNIFPTVLHMNDRGRLEMKFGADDIELYDKAVDRFSGLANYEDAQIIAGIRPESFVSSSQNTSGNKVSVLVTGVETLGHENIVYFRLSDSEEQITGKPFNEEMTTGKLYTMRLESTQHVEAGSKMDIDFDTEALYFFSRDGKAIAKAK